MAGALAGSATVLMTNPIWVVNTRMTTRKSEASDESLPGAPATPQKAPPTLGTLFALVREEGFARLFAGVMPALVLVINPILQYTVFEQLKQMLSSLTEHEEQSGKSAKMPKVVRRDAWDEDDLDDLLNDI